MGVEARKVAAAGEIARLEGQVREVESVEFLDAAVLLFDGQPLDDERTVGSHGLSRTTTVTLSQDPHTHAYKSREKNSASVSAETCKQAMGVKKSAGTKKWKP